MSDISPLGPSHGAFNRLRAYRLAGPPSRSAPPRIGDSVELSEASRLLARLSELPDVRQGLVDRVRGEIDAGRYVTGEKIGQAAESLLEDL